MLFLKTMNQITTKRFNEEIFKKSDTKFME